MIPREHARERLDDLNVRLRCVVRVLARSAARPLSSVVLRAYPRTTRAPTHSANRGTYGHWDDTLHGALHSVKSFELDIRKTKT